ncbi:succinyl-diaminopimelate desuccinylase [Desulfovibrio intestinalis]|uniref:Succinyl-diaminopimelate desuccinylase n=2 Tax=Desulfovibrio intestinalis TaxID=58621 RepID=A0A7W8FH46_9BACT|nr:M20 family metallo-hydrolase [Desulfovibrio intestinalis]MBB5144485.1 succinyl-diaminopimelate desuccinylase [Desulfovibrio intestinalis]
MPKDMDALLRGLAGREDRVVALQSALTACPALGPDNGGDGEEAKAALITQWLEACGVTDILRIDAPDARVPSGQRPNLVARIPGKEKRTLWLFGHMDVVPPGDLAAWQSDPWQVRREGDLLFGRGVEDNQQAITSMLLLAEELHQRHVVPQLSLGLVFMADEETGSAYGLEYLLKTAPELFSKNDLYIVPDAGARRGDVIEVAEKGQLWLKIRTTGVQCHASTPHKGRNAFLAGADMALACHNGLRAAFGDTNTLFNPPTSTFVPGKHEANVPNINTVPGSDVFYVDCRLLPQVDPQAVLDKVRALASEVEERHGVQIEVSVVQQQAASSVAETSPVVIALGAAVARVYGVEARTLGIGGATVAAQLRQRDLAAAVWSCLASTCHQPNESSSITATIKDAQVFTHILMNPAHV